jgi:hypothetical protein
MCRVTSLAGVFCGEAKTPINWTAIGIANRPSAQLAPTRGRLSNAPVTRLGVRLPADATHLMQSEMAIAA